ncbi:MAG: N-formylglutamate amidohydrolase [Acidobacteriota bacterium]
MKVLPEVVDDLELVEVVPVDPSQPADLSDDDILIFTIHDGAQVPRHLWGERSEEVLSRPDMVAAYVRERDWGANVVAEQLARQLGLSGYARVNLSRHIMDFGRFPGTSSVGENYLMRHSLFPPAELLLTEDAIHDLLARYYDGISQAITQHFANKRITIAIHSYDPYNANGTERPKIGLVTRSLSYQNESTIHPYVFDPLFPAILCEAVSDRALTYQVLLDLEKHGHHTALNYPYLMPEGSVEIRAQVWFFFRHLREHFIRTFPESRDRAEYQRVWQLLLDVTRRSPDCERLRAYLHRYRAAPAGLEELFQRCRGAYARIQEFLGTHRQALVDEYRYAPERPSCLGVEIRKDQLCWVDADNGTVEKRRGAGDFAHEVATIFAGSVLSYVDDKNRRADRQVPRDLSGRPSTESLEDTADLSA